MEVADDEEEHVGIGGPPQTKVLLMPLSTAQREFLKAGAHHTPNPEDPPRAEISPLSSEVFQALRGSHARKRRERWRRWRRKPGEERSLGHPLLRTS